MMTISVNNALFLGKGEIVLKIAAKISRVASALIRTNYLFFSSRCGPEKNFLDLAKILKGKVSDICQQYFKYLKFIFGPPCPREDCPGATFHVEKIQQACESSSSEGEGSSDSSEDTECSEAGPNEDVVGSTTVDENERRCHVIPMNLDSFEGPYWCREINVSEDLKDWDPASTAAEEVCLLNMQILHRNTITRYFEFTGALNLLCLKTK